MTTSDWAAQALCRDYDPEIWFPVGTTGPAVAQIAEAKAVCARCPVASECLAWALAMGEDDGVWGGKSEEERRALSRQDSGRVRVELDPPEGSCSAGRHSRTRVHRDGTGRERCYECAADERRARDARRALASV